MASCLLFSIAKSKPNVSLLTRPAFLVGGQHQTRGKTSSPSPHPIDNNNFDYQYIEKSAIPTLDLQKALPRLPIPPLEKTIDRYLSALQPIIPDANQFGKTVEVATTFRDGNEGKRLQELLVQYDRSKLVQHSSYIASDWFDMYLGSRDPLILWFNPFVELKNDPDPKYMSLPIRVTNILISSLRYRRSLNDEKLAPEVNQVSTETAIPLDMSQYSSIFNETRIPLKGRDEWKTYPESRHIVVLKGGQFFSFDVLEENGDIKSPEEIYASVLRVANTPVDPSKYDSITPLSSENRDWWAEARERLISSSEQNNRSLKEIDSAILVICIDGGSFHDRNSAAHNYLHGNIRDESRPLNRWFDKSVSLCFDGDGKLAINWEHSWGDGATILSAFGNVYKDSIKHHFVGPETPAVEAPGDAVKHLSFSLSPASKQDVEQATDFWRTFTGSLDINCIYYDRMTRGYFKSKKVSPDSIFQLAFQMAFHKVYSSTVPTYESCSTANFRAGRTEVIRSATMQTKAACEAFALKSKKSPNELRALLNECSNKHKTLAKEAQQGHGFDRHLTGLRMTAQREGLTKPDIFIDKSYTDASYYVLSTSNLFGGLFSLGGFGPVATDGYGLGYGFVDDNLALCCSSFNGKRDGTQMAQAFIESLDEIRSVFESS